MPGSDRRVSSRIFNILGRFFSAHRLQYKVMAVFLIFILLGAVSFFLTRRAIQGYAGHGQLINTAGSERFLVQIVVRDTALVVAETGEIPPTLEPSMVRFDEVLARLDTDMDGFPVSSQLRLEIEADLAEITATWRMLQANVRAILSSGDEALRRDLLRSVTELGDRMQIQTDHLVSVIEADFRRKIDGVLQLLGLILLLGAVSVSLGLWLSHRWVVQPIQTLHRASLNIAGGHWRAQAPVQGRDEIAALGRAFNQMADVIASTLEKERTQRRFTAALLANLPVGILALKEDLTIVVYNEALEQLVASAGDDGRADPKHLHGVCLEDLFRGQGLAERARQVMRNGTPIYDLNFSVDAGALQKHFRLAMAAMRPGEAADQDDVRLLVVVEDVTKEVEVRQKNKRLASIVQATTDLVVTADVAGQVKFLNAAARSQLGWEGVEDSGQVRSVLDAFGPEDQTLLRQVGIPAALESGVWSGEASLIDMRGRQIPVSQVILAQEKEGAGSAITLIMRDISERKRLESQLAYLADHDALTGLYNRRRFQQELAHGLEQAVSQGGRGALLFVDLNNFKQINDNFGHTTGDETLRNVAKLVQDRLSATHLIGRLGGDEFAILLPDANVEQARAVANHLLSGLQYCAFNVGDEVVHVTASIGIALYPSHGSSKEELLARADLAMYEAKAAGHNQVVLYTPDRHRSTPMDSVIYWEDRIRDAFANDRFELDAQPILHLGQNSVTQYELLLRMRDEDGDIVMPREFLGLAEASGLIRSIDRWVVRRAVQHLSLPLPGRAGYLLHVSLSAKSLMDPAFIRVVEQEVSRDGVDAARLVFEITETAAIADLEQAEAFITAIRKWGCRFALDDVGEGFFSFLHLKHLSVDMLKIDGAFVRNLAHDREDRHVVKALVEVARGRERQTVAKEVGDDETLQLLRAYGVDYAQGFHIGRPRPIGELESGDPPVWCCPAT